MNDLASVLKLLDKLLIFRSEVLEINSFETFSDLVQDCAIKCHELTYSNVFQECEEYQGKWGESKNGGLSKHRISSCKER